MANSLLKILKKHSVPIILILTVVIAAVLLLLNKDYLGIEFFTAGLDIPGKVPTFSSVAAPHMNSVNANWRQQIDGRVRAMEAQTNTAKSVLKQFEDQFKRGRRLDKLGFLNTIHSSLGNVINATQATNSVTIRHIDSSIAARTNELMKVIDIYFNSIDKRIDDILKDYTTTESLNQTLLSRNYITKFEVEQSIKPLQDLIEKNAQNRPSDFSPEQQKLLEEQFIKVRTEIANAVRTSTATDDKHRIRLDDAAQGIDDATKARGEILRIIRDEVPKYAKSYIKEENTKQHQQIVGHVDKVVANMNSATTSNLNNLRDAMINRSKKDNADLERRVADATSKQLSQTLHISRGLSERVVDYHNKASHIGNK